MYYVVKKPSAKPSNKRINKSTNKQINITAHVDLAHRPPFPPPVLLQA